MKDYDYNFTSLWKGIAFFSVMAIIFTLATRANVWSVFDRETQAIEPSNVTRYYTEIEWLDLPFVHPDVWRRVDYSEMRARALEAMEARGENIADFIRPEGVPVATANARAATRPTPAENRTPNVATIDEVQEDVLPAIAGGLQIALPIVKSEDDTASAIETELESPAPVVPSRPAGGDLGGVPSVRAPVMNFGGSATIVFGMQDVIDLAEIEGLFTMDADAGAASFFILGDGTGAGTIRGSVLTVSRAGGFSIGMTTAETGTHAAGEVVIGELTVLRGEGAAVGIPEIASRRHNAITVREVAAPRNGQRVEYSLGIDDANPWDIWQRELVFEGLDADTTYFVFARSAENGLFETGEWQVSVGSVQPAWVMLDADIASGETLRVNRGETAIVAEGVTVQNHGTIHLGERATLVIDGELMNSHRVFVDRFAGVYVIGGLANGIGSVIDNHGRIDVQGELVNEGQISNRAGGSIEIDGLLDNVLAGGELNVDAVIYNWGEIVVGRSGALMNLGGAFLHNRVNAVMEIEGELVNGDFDEAVRIQNDGEIFVRARGVLMNWGRILNRRATVPTPSGRIVVEGELMGEEGIEGVPVE